MRVRTGQAGRSGLGQGGSGFGAALLAALILIFTVASCSKPITLVAIDAGDQLSPEALESVDSAKESVVDSEPSDVYGSKEVDGVGLGDEPSLGTSEDTGDAFEVAVADTGQLGDTETASSTQPSSLTECLCWPSGDNCQLFGGSGPLLSNPAKKCPAGEVCIGDTTVVSKEGIVMGFCARPCTFAGATLPGAGSCSPGEECKLTVLLANTVEPSVYGTLGVCMPTVRRSTDVEVTGDTK